VQIGEPAVPALVEALTNRTVGPNAASVLGRVKATEAVPALIEQLRSDWMPGCRAAALALAEIGDPQTLDAIVETAHNWSAHEPDRYEPPDELRDLIAVLACCAERIGGPTGFWRLIDIEAAPDSPEAARLGLSDAVLSMELKPVLTCLMGVISQGTHARATAAMRILDRASAKQALVEAIVGDADLSVAERAALLDRMLQRGYLGEDFVASRNTVDICRRLLHSSDTTVRSGAQAIEAHLTLARPVQPNAADDRDELLRAPSGPGEICVPELLRAAQAPFPGQTRPVGLFALLVALLRRLLDLIRGR
jgi:hypothetical protein